MSLAVEVGVLADLKQHDAEGAAWLTRQIEQLNAALAERGLEPHSEPETVGRWERRSLASVPYSWLHHLRRVYCSVRTGEPLRTGDLSDDDEAFVMDVTAMAPDSHLLNHGDSEGFYLPRELAEVLCDERLVGGFAGSCVALQAELLKLAPALGVELGDGAPTPAAISVLADLEADEAHEQYHARQAWFSLWEGTQRSLATGALLVFQ